MAEPKKRNNKWHGTVYSHTENGKRIYQSITADTKAEWYAAEKEFKAKKALGEKKESVPNSEFTKSTRLKGCKSSIPSPRPM